MDSCFYNFYDLFIATYTKCIICNGYSHLMICLLLEDHFFEDLCTNWFDCFNDFFVNWLLWIVLFEDLSVTGLLVLMISLLVTNLITLLNDSFCTNCFYYSFGVLQKTSVNHCFSQKLTFLFHIYNCFEKYWIVKCLDSSMTTFAIVLLIRDSAYM